MLLTDRPKRVSGVVGRQIEEEEVVVDPQRNMVRVLNSVGARLWSLADGQHTIAFMAAIIAQEYAVELERAQSDALTFCEDLVSRGLLVVTP